MKRQKNLMTGLLICACLLIGVGLTIAGELADMILFNGKIITIDSQDHIYTALAIKDGRILAVGSTTEIGVLAGPYCKKINLHGKTVTPGLIDSHYHLMYYGAQFWPGYLNIRVPVVQSKADLLQVLSDHVKGLQPGEWVSANQGFTLHADETLTRWDIDAVAPNNPCYLRHTSGQYAVVNSLALTIAGIDTLTPNPPSSLIMKNEQGELTGVLSHYGAENLVAQYATGYGDRTDEQKFEDIDTGQRLCLQAGYTSVQDVIVGAVKDINLYKQYADEGKLKVRIYAMLLVDTRQEADSLVKKFQPIQSGRFKFGGWKLAMDGGIGARTTLFYDKTMFASEISYPYHDQETLNYIVQKLDSTGLQVATHVSGDEGIDMTITAYEEAIKTNPPRDRRFRIEHGLFPTTAALQRMKNSHIILSTQPQWIPWFGQGFTDATNEATMALLLPFKTMLGMGIRLAFGCDVPASGFQEPQWAFRGAILRRTVAGTPLSQSEKLAPNEALRIHTMGSAYAGFAENETGSLEPGKFADLVIWSHDLYTMDPAQLSDFHPELTMVEGEILHDTGENPVTYAQGSWVTIGELLSDRQNHCTTLLNNGKVLIVGWNSKVAELFDPTAGVITATGATAYTHRQGFTATLLQDGRVLVAGGVNAQQIAEIYDPATGLFSLTDSLNVPHCYHTASLLSDGQVLIAAGQNNTGPQTHAVAELYDPQTGRFTVINSLNIDRSSHTATTLANGQILLCGGIQTTTPGSGISLASCELFDPVAGTFAPAANMASPRTGQTATLLPSGLVFIGGGAYYNNRGELYDYATNTFSQTGAMATIRRSYHTATLLKNGQVLLTGGSAATVTKTCELYDPDSNAFYPANDLNTPRMSHVATTLPDGSILVNGGYDGQNTLKSVERMIVLPADAVLVHPDRTTQTEIPEDYYLSPNFPNPFNPFTQLRYKIKTSARVKIVVFNVKGEQIKILFNDVRAGGEYRISWDGTGENGMPAGSGIYVIKLEANRHIASRKVLLLR